MPMLYLYFCDDQPAFLNRVSQLAQKGLLMQDWDIRLGGTFTAPEKLLNHLPSATDTGLYFLDLELASPVSGFDVAKEIRKKDPKAFLVFLSSHDELALEAFRYRLEAMDFIKKSEDKAELFQRIYDCIQTAWQRYTALNVSDSEILTWKEGKTIRFLPCADILFIQNSSVPHHIAVFTAEAMFDRIGSLNEILTEHPAIFLRCSRSLLVNKRHVKEISLLKREVLLDNGSVFPCSIRNLPILKKISRRESF